MKAIAPSASRALVVACTAIGLWWFAGCAHDTVAPAAGRFSLGALAFEPPPGAGWLRLERSAEQVVFGKREPAGLDHRGAADAQAVDLTAWVKRVRTDHPVGGYAALHAIIVRMTDQIDRTRFELHRHLVEPLDTPDTACVRRSIVLDDHRGPAAASTGVMAMRMVDVLCRDPQQPNTFYSIHVSERSAHLRTPDLAMALTEQWFAKMRFDAASGAAP